MWPANLSSPLGIEPAFPAVEAQRPNHWTAREFPDIHSYAQENEV